MRAAASSVEIPGTVDLGDGYASHHLRGAVEESNSEALPVFMA
jgi:hypothetical protein